MDHASPIRHWATHCQVLSDSGTLNDHLLGAAQQNAIASRMVYRLLCIYTTKPDDASLDIGGA